MYFWIIAQVTGEFTKRVEICYTRLVQICAGGWALKTKQDTVAKARSEGRTILTEIESKELIKQAGIAVSDTRLATSREEAISISRQLGFPAGLPVGSPDWGHK